jgi:FKBP-type peptidyl-prolyl cis-trans isomerase (trigger factor)
VVRLPGFRPGKIPASVLEARYGPKIRAEVIQQFAGDAVEQAWAKNEVAAEPELISGANAGDVELRLTVTHLAELPPMEFEAMKLERLSADGGPVAPEVFENHLRQQILDALDAAYGFPLARGLVDREFALIRKALGQVPADVSPELRAIAGRRVRLGAVVAELARRHSIAPSEEELRQRMRAGETSESARSRLTEEKLISFVLERGQISERRASDDELRELAQN